MLVLLMILTSAPVEVFGHQSRNAYPNKETEVKYKVVNINGQKYKAYKISDIMPDNIVKKNSQIRAFNLGLMSIPGYVDQTEPDPTRLWTLKINWETRDIDFPNKKILIPVYYNPDGLENTGDEIELGIFEVDPSHAKKGNKNESIKMQVKEGIDPWQYLDGAEIICPKFIKYDLRIWKNNVWNDTPIQQFQFVANVSQNVMSVYKISWFDNYKSKRQEFEGKWKGSKSIETDLVGSTEDGYYTVIQELIGRDDFYTGNKSDEPYTPVDKTLVGELKQGYKQKPIDPDNLTIDDVTPVDTAGSYIRKDGVETQKGFLELGTKYYYNITGDYRTLHEIKLREALKVNFDPNGATFASAVKTEQEIGHSMKIGEAFGDLEAVTVPTKDQISNIPQKDNKDQELVGWVVDKANKSLDFSDGKNDDKLVNPNGYEVKKNVTFYAVYAPKAQGKIEVKYVAETDKNTDLDTKLLMANQFVDGKEIVKELKDNADKTITKADAEAKVKEVLKDNKTAPVFVGYKFKAVEAENNLIYKKDSFDTIKYVYEKLDDIVGPLKPTDEFPEGYVAVKFFADDSGNDRGEFTGSKKDLVYAVNPYETEIDKVAKTLSGKKANGAAINVDFPTYSVNDASKATWKTNDTNPWVMAPENAIGADKKIDVDKLGTQQDLTFTAQYEKEKGTVTYEYKYENKTSITDPSKKGIPTVPTDAKEYKVGTTVNAETTVAKDKTVPVKDNSGTTIGNWTFSGWKDSKDVEGQTTIVKGENKFTGTWTFTEAGKHGVTYKFTDESGKALPAESGQMNKFPDVPTDANTYYENQDITLKTTPAVNTEVKGTNGNKQGTWKFLGWYKGETKLTEATVKAADKNEFVGKWSFTEDGKKDVEFSFKFYNSKKPTEEIGSSVLNGKFEPTVPDKQTGKYVGNEFTLPTIDPAEKQVNFEDMTGTWKFDGWYKSTDTTYQTKLTGKQVVSEDDANNKYVGKWILEETATAKVTRKFVIDPNIMGDGKDVPTDHNLPDGVIVTQKVSDTENYIGSTQTPGKDKFDPVEEKIGDKIGTWTFVKWDKAQLTVSATEADNVFTGTWTWTWKQEKSKQPEVNKPKEGDKTITGRGIAGSDIVVELPDGTKVPGKVDQNGDWTVDLPKDKDLKDGDNLKVTQEEKGKTPSDPVDVTVGSKEIEPEPQPEPKPEPKPVPEPEFNLDFKEHQYVPTFPVYASVPDKGTKVIDTLWYIFHIDKYDYEEVRNYNSTSHKMDVTPVIRNERTMLPLRYVAEAIGADVKWDPKTRTATFTKDGLTATIQIDSDEIVLSNGKTVKMDSKPLNINARILVSVVNVGNVFGLTNGNTLDGIDQDIEWDHDTRTATIYIRR